MNQTNARKFVYEVLKRTEQELIPWYPTDRDNRFEASLPEQSLVIYEETRFDKEVAEHYTVHILALINEQGRIVSEVDPEEMDNILDNPRKLLESIYVIARDQALGVDDELKKFFSTFEHADKSEDEIPF